MSAEFDVTITDKDMFRFNMYHSYHGFHGIFATVLGVLILGVAAATAGKAASMYTILYTVFGIVFLVYMPVSLYMRSKQQVMSSEVLKNALHYKVDEVGVHVSQNEQTADLPWDQIYRVVSTKNNLLIYSSRMNAYVIPRNAITQQYGTITALAESHLEKFRRKMDNKTDKN